MFTIARLQIKRIESISTSARTVVAPYGITANLTAYSAVCLSTLVNVWNEQRVCSDRVIIKPTHTNASNGNILGMGTTCETKWSAPVQRKSRIILTLPTHGESYSSHSSKCSLDPVQRTSCRNTGPSPGLWMAGIAAASACQ